MADINQFATSAEPRGEKIRVLLDTAAIRALIHGESEAQPLEELHRFASLLSVALANNTVPELALALHEERIPWKDWSSRGHLIDRLLDRASPIFPDERELECISTGTTRPSSSGLPRAEHSRAIWDLLRRAKEPADLMVGPSFVGSDGIEYKIQSSKELAERLSETHRGQWRGMIRQLWTQISSHHPTQEHIAELQFKTLFGDNSPESLRCPQPRRGVCPAVGSGCRGSC